MTYDPVPDLAALIDGLRRTDRLLANREGTLLALADLLAGPYARLRGGLLLDEPGREHVSTETALRKLLNENVLGPFPDRPCVVCGNPLPHEKCSPVIINASSRR